MPLADIVDTADIHTELGGALNAADLTLLGTIRSRVERSIRKFVRWSITEATYTHFLPARGFSGQMLQLPEPYVTSVTSVYEDAQAKGGQDVDDFPSSSLLVAGDDYQLDYDEASYSRSGILFRRGRLWPATPRTVKVTYVSGFDSAALADEFLFVQSAVINETIEKFHYRKERQGASGVAGTVKSEKLKDYSISYAVGADALSSDPSGLSANTRADLEPIMFMGRML